MHSSILDKVNKEGLPKHIAIIMDGNGRWAGQNGQPRLFGHRHGVSAVKSITEACAEMGISYLTLYAFSTENWNRPQTEVIGLMHLLVETIKSEIKTLSKNNICLKAIGDLNYLPEPTRKALLEGIEKTKNNSRLTLILALNYSARWELLNATNQIAKDASNGTLTLPVDDKIFATYLTTSGIPDPELLIRTSGEIRISNFLLWQIAYTELYFTETLWPDFSKEHLYQAIYDYQQRERRFGKTSEQIKN
jgi:undecaprenyl diphosphate synthase